MKELKILNKIALKWGALAGLLGCIILVTLYMIGRHPFLIPIIFDFRIVLLSVFLFFLLRDFRDNHQGGILYFWQGMIGSFIFILVYAIVAALGILILESIRPDFLTSYIDLSIQQIKSLPAEVLERIGTETVQQSLEALPHTGLFELPKLYIVQSFAFGLFISIILSVILRKQPKI